MYIVQINSSQGPSVEMFLFPWTTVNLFVQLYKCIVAAHIILYCLGNSAMDYSVTMSRGNTTTQLSWCSAH